MFEVKKVSIDDRKIATDRLIAFRLLSISQVWSLVGDQFKINLTNKEIREKDLPERTVEMH